MIPAATPHDEAPRLQAVRRLRLLDTPFEDRFDRLTRIAAATFRVPIATLTLVDSNRQWFKACVGLDERSGPREHSFCAHAILSAETLVIPDARADERFCDNPLVTGPPGIRFYAGHPLTAPGGERVGTLCIIDTVPRALTSGELDVLRDLALMAQDELNRTRRQEDDDAAARREHTESRVWTILNSVGEAIVSFEESGIIRVANPAAERTFGAGPGGLDGVHVDELVEGLDFAAAERGYGVGSDTAPSLGDRSQRTGVRRDGTTFPLELTVEEAVAGSRRILVAIGQDISERVAAESALRRSERRFRAVFDHAGFGIIVCGLHPETGMYVVDVNPRFEEMVGWPAEALRGGDLGLIAHPDDDLREDEELIAWILRADSRPYRRIVPTVRRDGSTFYGEVMLTILLDSAGRASALVGIFEDVTQRREAERMKDEFISIVGHEVRTPLTSIRGSLGLVAGGVLGEIPAEAGEMLEVAVTNTDLLIRLVNDMLDVERMDAGRLVLMTEPLAASALVEQSLAVVEGMASQAGVTLHVEGDAATVQADADRIVQALTNLLGNAIKFSPAGGRIVVAVAREEAFARFSVRDQGRGIPVDQLGAVFERFRQVDASDAREKGGTGLGLAIARGIVDAHGGRIWAQSAPGEGCTMLFTVPLASGRPAA